MIIFPMAGLSQRFTNRGYDVPKFQLPLWEGTVFDYAVSSFAPLFKSTSFLFIYRETGGVLHFLESRIEHLGIREAMLVPIEAPTAGQAETVEIGLAKCGLAEAQELTIFNIDTFRMPWSRPQGLRSDVDGWLEVFQGAGDNWSFLRPSNEEGIVSETAEKTPISELCCTGLYHFNKLSSFKSALNAERDSPSSSELYIAPIYNHLIGKGLRIGFGLIQSRDVMFCGVPSEYEALVNTPPPYSLCNPRMI
jgi:hypothetical protein